MKLLIVYYLFPSVFALYFQILMIQPNLRFLIAKVHALQSLDVIAIILIAENVAK